MLASAQDRHILPSQRSEILQLAQALRRLLSFALSTTDFFDQCAVQITRVPSILLLSDVVQISSPYFHTAFIFDYHDISFAFINYGFNNIAHHFV